MQLPSSTLSYEEIVRYLTPQERREFDEALLAQMATRRFYPNIDPETGRSPQLMALLSEAAVIGYGGAAGGGKTELMTGLALDEHQRTVIFRREKTQTEGIIQRIETLLGTTAGYSSQKSTWRVEHRLIEFGGLDDPKDWRKFQGRAHDLIAIDEATECREADVRVVLGWLRTDDPDQRLRALLTFNPPTTAEGRWIIRYFAPWLQKGHPNPAKDGELRYFAMIAGAEVEVEGPDPFVLIEGKRVYTFEPSEHKPQEIITPQSRTFIHAKVTDNPFYMATGYIQQLQMLPEPLRSQMLEGDFMAGAEDDAHQLIPTEWIDLAIQRWKARQADIRAAGKGPMDALGVDAARGGNMGSTTGAIGKDELVLSPRYGTYFDTLVNHKGVNIDDGAKVAAIVISERRDSAPVQIDVVGIGTSPYDFLRQNHVHAVPLNGAAASRGMDKSGLFKFANMRAEWGWRMREALDPIHGDNIALPPDDQMAADLASFRWKVTKQGIQLEDKDVQKKMLGRSPDRGDAVIYANITTPKLQMAVTGYAGLPAQLQGTYEERRFRELEQ